MVYLITKIYGYQINPALITARQDEPAFQTSDRYKKHALPTSKIFVQLHAEPKEEMPKL
jgi:hypothetical protein